MIKSIPYAPIPSASGLGVGFRSLNTFSQGIWSTRVCLLVGENLSQPKRIHENWHIYPGESRFRWCEGSDFFERYIANWLLFHLGEIQRKFFHVSRWFKPWPFLWTLIGGQQKPLKGSRKLNHPKKGTKNHQVVDFVVLLLWLLIDHCCLLVVVCCCLLVLLLLLLLLLSSSLWHLRRNPTPNVICVSGKHLHWPYKELFGLTFPSPGVGLNL